MAKPAELSFQVPYRDKLTGDGGLLTAVWESFFRYLYSVVSPLGVEKAFQLGNDISVPTDLEGLQFDFNKVNSVIIDFCVQRISVGVDGEEKFETGMLVLTYLAKSAEWSIYKAPDLGVDAGITFSVTPGGQVQYVSTSINDDEDLVKVNRVTLRARTLSAKIYTPVGGWL